jgi:Carboxylesterase family
MDAAAGNDHYSEINDATYPFATSGWSMENSTTSAHQHNIGFQRVLGKFFGDYFKEDADEEIASDMADRWVSFAKTGDPNYESGVAQWKPWRYLFDGELEVEDGQMWQPENFDEFFDISHIDETQPYVNGTVIEGYLWSDDPAERTYRRRALLALGMEVVEEDAYQTMLRRIKFGEETDNPFHNFLMRIASSHTTINRRLGGGKDKNLRRTVRQLQRIAQDMGFIGTGLGGEPRRRDAPSSDFWEDAFFPEIMELKWPPEGRLVEVSIFVSSNCFNLLT